MTDAEMQSFVKELNKFYKDNKCFWEDDCSWEGFSWISNDDNSQSIIAFRRIDKSGDEIIAVCNFVPVSREGYRIGVPSGGKYTVVMNSDWKKYGGETDETKKVYVTDEEPMHSFDDSISLDLPAMSVIYLKQTAKKRKSATKKAKN